MYFLFLTEAPLKQIPTLITSEGVVCQSNVIARHVAKKLGNVGVWIDIVLIGPWGSVRLTS